MPISRRRPPFPWRTSSDPRRAARSRSESASASWTRSPARRSTTTIARSRQPWRSSRAWRITATISSTVAGSAGHEALVTRRPSRVVARHGRRRTMPTGGIEHCGNGHGCSSHETADNSARPLPAEPSPLLRPESRVDRTLPLPLHPGEPAPRDARGDGPRHPASPIPSVSRASTGTPPSKVVAAIAADLLGTEPVTFNLPAPDKTTGRSSPIARPHQPARSAIEKRAPRESCSEATLELAPACRYGQNRRRLCPGQIARGAAGIYEAVGAAQGVRLSGRRCVATRGA
jgi:hypothetical protein